tara:strand:- start:395 stop:1003 length:609 start_codon:yes stop_codon:yes gene_type:complete
MTKNNDVPSSEGYVKYDKNAQHIKSFSGKYRPLLIFTNKNCSANILLNFLMEGKEEYVEKDNMSFHGKSTMEIRKALSEKKCSVVITEDHTEEELKDIHNILNYYTYSAILFYDRTNPIDKNKTIWDMLDSKNTPRAAICVQDLYKENINLYILQTIFNYIHVDISTEQFTNAKIYGIIKRVNNDENYVMNKHSISNIHMLK